MSKRAIDDDDKGDFWKNMRYGAAAAVTLGSGIYAVTSVLKKQGLSNFVDEFKTAMHAAPHLMADTTPKTAMQPDDEQRAVLNMQLNFAMERQDMQRVQQITRELDKLEANVSATPQVNMMTPQISTSSQTQQIHMAKQMPSSAPSPMQMAPLQMSFQDTSFEVPVRQMTSQISGQRMSSQQMVSHMPVQQMPVQQMPVQQMPGQQMPGQQMPVQQMLVQQMPAPQTLNQQMPVQQVAPAQGGTLSFDKTPGDTATHKEAQKEAQKGARQEAHQEALQSPQKPLEPTPRQAAMQMLQAGDIVEALDPVTAKWTPAAIHAIAKNGLVEVRWDDPGMDGKGKPFHPIGEVWAEQIRLKWRPAPVVAPTPQKTAAPVPEEPEAPPDGLQVGDSCYAMGQVVTKTWFAAKLIGVRARSPPMRVEYLATLDGQTAELLLPSPRKDFVHLDHLRRDRPEVEISEVSRREALEKEAKAAEEKHAALQNDADDDVVISPDLMCVMCERPDDEPNMLVCDCKKGYHIYCLTPPLEEVPEGDWKCPKCANK